MQRSGSAPAAALLFAMTLGGCSDSVTNPQFSGPPVPVAVKFCAAVAPVWVGYQNGTGPWVGVSRDAGSTQTYTFTINGGGALAYVLPAGGDPASFGYNTEVVYATAEELQKFVIGGCYQAQPTGVKTIRGALAGLGTNELGQISLGGSSVGVVSANGSDANYTLRRVADAPQDLIAVRRTSLSNAGDIAKLIVRRGINPTDGTTLSSLDFNSAEAVQPVSATLSVTGNELGALMSVSSSFATAGGSSVLFTGVQTTASTVPFMGMGSGTVAGDLHVLSVDVQDTFTEDRSTETYFRSMGSRSLSLGPTLSPVTVTAVSGIPNVRLRMDIPSQAEYASAGVAEISSGGYGPVNRNFELVVTAGYLGGVPTTWSILMPDLTTAAGYDVKYGMSSAVGLDWIAIASGGSRQFFIPAADGQSFSYGLREGAVVQNSAANPPSLAAPGVRASHAFVPAGRPWTRAQP